MLSERKMRLYYTCLVVLNSDDMVYINKLEESIKDLFSNHILHDYKYYDKFIDETDLSIYDKLKSENISLMYVEEANINMYNNTLFALEEIFYGIRRICEGYSTYLIFKILEKIFNKKIVEGYMI